MSTMKAVPTAEQRPTYLSISGIHNKLVRATHRYQDGIEFIVVVFCESPRRIRPPLFGIFRGSAFGVVGPAL